MSLLRRAMLYLGLGPDEEYDDYAAPTSTGVPSEALATPPEREDVGSVRTINPQERTVRAVPAPEAAAAGAREGGARVVRTIQPPSRPTVVSPVRFNDAQQVGDRFRADQPVIVNLTALDEDLSRRLVDFASGLCYGLEGHMEKITHRVFLLVPAKVEIPPEERRRLKEQDYHG